MASNEKFIRPVSISEAKKTLTKLSKERKELNYEQKIALEHAQMFAKLPVTKVNAMIKELQGIEFIQEKHACKIADILPTTGDEVKTIFAKERITIDEKDIKKILEIVEKYYVE